MAYHNQNPTHLTLFNLLCAHPNPPLLDELRQDRCHVREGGNLLGGEKKTWTHLFPPVGIDSMHYRLRGPIGLLNVQKVSESRRLFLTEGTSKTDNFALFVKIMTQIFCTIIFSQGWQSETGQKSDKCLEKPEGGLRRS